MSDYSIEITESVFSEAENPPGLFGIKITAAGGEIMSFPALSADAAAVTSTAQKLKRFSVSPVHIADIIEDEFFYPSR